MELVVSSLVQDELTNLVNLAEYEALTTGYNWQSMLLDIESKH